MKKITDYFFYFPTYDLVDSYSIYIVIDKRLKLYKHVCNTMTIDNISDELFVIAPYLRNGPNNFKTVIPPKRIIIDISHMPLEFVILIISSKRRDYISSKVLYIKMFAGLVNFTFSMSLKILQRTLLL